MKSDAAGVTPAQIPEAHAELARHGVKTEYDGHTGQAIFRDAEHRRRHCEALGYFDRNGGYGDPQQRAHDIAFEEEDASRLPF